jgi:hypothetical protein
MKTVDEIRTDPRSTSTASPDGARAGVFGPKYRL